MLQIIPLFTLFICSYGLKFQLPLLLPSYSEYSTNLNEEIDGSVIKNITSKATQVTIASEDNYDINSKVPFLIKNSKTFNPLNASNECFDDYLYSKLQMKAIRKNISYTNSAFEQYYHSTRVVKDMCIPLFGNTNDITVGYWDNENEKRLTPAHHDNTTNIIWCQKGRKTFLVYPPEDHDNLYLQPNTVGKDSIVPFKLENVNYTKYPKVRNTSPYVAVVEANDILFLPHQWIHHVYSEEHTTCVTYWLQKSSFQPFKKDDVPRRIKVNHVKISNNNVKQKPPDLWWFKYKMGIRLALSNGQLVKIPNAFENPERFELNTTKDWKMENGERMGFEWYERHLCKKCVTPFTQEIRKYMHFFEDVLMTSVDNKDRLNVTFSGSKYKEGSYLDPHMDFSDNRILSVVYHITPSWEERCGGELLWWGGIGQKVLPPSYNTLYLFIPRPTSSHSISHVHCGERYAFGGWLKAKRPSSEFLLLTHSFRWANENKPGDVYHIGENMGTRNGIKDLN